MSASAASQSKNKAVARVTSGNFLGTFDRFPFGFRATYISN